MVYTSLEISPKLGYILLVCALARLISASSKRKNTSPYKFKTRYCAAHLETKFDSKFSIFAVQVSVSKICKFDSKFERKKSRRSVFVIDEADEQGQRSVYIIRDCSPQRDPTKYRAKNELLKKE